MRISDWSSDVCSSDLEQTEHEARDVQVITRPACERLFDFCFRLAERRQAQGRPGVLTCVDKANVLGSMVFFRRIFDERASLFPAVGSEEHTSELQSLMRISYAVFCLKKKNTHKL